MENKKRVHYYDGLRVICAIFIVLIHSISIRAYDFSNLNDSVWLFMNSTNIFTRVGVLTFFMISGALLLNSKKNDSIEYVLRHRVLGLVVKLAIFSVIYAFIYGKVLDIADYSVVSFIKDFLSNGVEIKFWFLYVLIGLYLSTPLLRVLVEKADRKYLWYLVILSLVATYLKYDVDTILNINSKMDIPIASSFIGVYVLGYLLSTMTLSKKSRYLLYGIAIASGLFRVLITNDLSIASNSLNTEWLSEKTFNILISSAALFVFAKESKGFDTFSRVVLIKESAKLTLGIYLLHPVIIKYMVTTVGWKTADMQIYHVLLIFIIALLGSALITLILSKIKYLNKLVS